MSDAHRRPDARCPLRPGQPCTLCQLDVTGPQDCPLVYLVMHDPDLREELHKTALRAATDRADRQDDSPVSESPRSGRQSS